MKYIITTVLLILFIVTPAMANSSYNYQINHSVELTLDGDYTFNTTVQTPAQGNVTTDLAGVGKAELRSILEIVESRIETRNWFDLF
jgi:hypothetical protein